MWDAERAGKKRVDKLGKLEQVGVLLNTAYDMRGCPDGSLGRRAAWQHTERAIELLGQAIDETDSLQDVVSTACERASTPSGQAEVEEREGDPKAQRRFRNR